jgi:plasmid maintenance system antidote protein VapI
VVELFGLVEASLPRHVGFPSGSYFGITLHFWMNLQTDYDLRAAAAWAPLIKIKQRRAA